MKWLRLNSGSIFLTVLVLSIIISLITFYLKNNISDTVPVDIGNTSPPPPSSLWFKKPPNPENVRCTADVKCCPDGTCVGRVAPSCSFAPCPQDNKY